MEGLSYVICQPSQNIPVCPQLCLQPTDRPGSSIWTWTQGGSRTRHSGRSLCLFTAAGWEWCHPPASAHWCLLKRVTRDDDTCPLSETGASGKKMASTLAVGLPWWSRGGASSLQRRRPRFGPCSGKTLDASDKPSACTATSAPAGHSRCSLHARGPSSAAGGASAGNGPALHCTAAHLSQLENAPV
uniref:Uncharacterized protein n=1 Tax=Rangifer tarandus platyrhynchus TaxID=3082113 RepID=A0ACB0FBI3_RANTA|nr:unnamed protein product [Rangifer tarandus platyrhynchus]